MSTGVWQLARSRAVWLLLLIVAATLTVNVLQLFEATLEEVTTLALFVSPLVGTGGNAGAQAATATVRALAVVAVSLVLICAWATSVGATMPLLDVKGLVDAAAVAGLRKDRIDPTRLAGTPGSYPAPERSLVALNAVGR